MVTIRTRSRRCRSGRAIIRNRRFGLWVLDGVDEPAHRWNVGRVRKPRATMPEVIASGQWQSP
jgi:hypothetical protein